MATLILDRNERTRFGPGAAASPLRTWLAGDWALLFSHPHDFANYDVEADRWLVLLQRAFENARVRPVALACGSSADAAMDGWLVEVTEARMCVTLGDDLPHIADFGLHALRGAIERANSRFVMIIDAALHLRRTFAYSPRDRLPSLFDLIATAEKVRAGQAAASLRALPADRAPKHLTYTALLRPLQALARRA
jgi:hypothetical protein